MLVICQNLKRLPLWFIISIFSLIVVQFTWSNFQILQNLALDFGVLYHAGEQVLSGQNPYREGALSDFHTPPPSLLFFALLTILLPLTSQLFWYLLSLASFCLGSYLLFKIIHLHKKSFKPTLKFWLVYLSLTLVFFPFRYNLGSGEVNNFLFLFLILTFYLLNQKKDTSATLFLSLGIIFKITPLFFLLIFLLQKKLRLLLQVFIWLGVFLILTISFFGPEIILNYLAVIPRYFQLYDPVYYNQSLTAHFLRFDIDPSTTKILTNIFLTVFLGLFVYLHKKLNPPNFNSNLLLWNIGILYTLIFSTFAWQHHFTIAIFPLVTTIYLAYQQKHSLIFYLLIFFSYLLIGLNIKNPTPFTNNLFWRITTLSHVFWGALLLLAVNFYLAKKLIAKKLRT